MVGNTRTRLSLKLLLSLRASLTRSDLLLALSRCVCLSSDMQQQRDVFFCRWNVEDRGLFLRTRLSKLRSQSPTCTSTGPHPPCVYARRPQARHILFLLLRQQQVEGGLKTCSITFATGTGRPGTLDRRGVRPCRRHISHYIPTHRSTHTTTASQDLLLAATQVESHPTRRADCHGRRSNFSSSHHRPCPPVHGHWHRPLCRVRERLESDPRGPI